MRPQPDFNSFDKPDPIWRGITQMKWIKSIFVYVFCVNEYKINQLSWDVIKVICVYILFSFNIHVKHIVQGNDVLTNSKMLQRFYIMKMLIYNFGDTTRFWKILCLWNCQFINYNTSISNINFIRGSGLYFNMKVLKTESGKIEIISFVIQSGRNWPLG